MVAIKAFKLIFQTMIYVLGGSVISAAIFITVFYPGVQLTVALLWQLIFMSFISSIGTLAFVSKKEIGKKQMKLRQRVHFVYINFIVLLTAILCGWVDVSRILELVFMILLVILVYFVVTFIMFKKSEKEAESMNKRLRKIYPEEEKEEQT